MAALDDLKVRIAYEIDRTDVDSAVADAVTSAIKFYKFKRFVFNETTNTLTTVSGTSEYTTALDAPNTLPDDILELDTARITINSSDRYLLSPLTFEDIDGRDTSSTYTSRPVFYAWRAENLRLYPTPNDAYVIDLRYLANIDEETWATRAEAMIRCRAKKELYAHVLWNAEKAMLMEQFEKQEFDALKREYVIKNSSGRVVPHN